MQFNPILQYEPVHISPGSTTILWIHRVKLIVTNTRCHQDTKFNITCVVLSLPFFLDQNNESSKLNSEKSITWYFNEKAEL